MTDRRTPPERRRNAPPHATGRRGPFRDLGPAATHGFRLAYGHRATDPAGILEAVELASMLAEAKVAPLLRTTTTPFGLGCASVGLRFFSHTVLPLFLKADVLTGEKRSFTHLMARRWAYVGGDVRLDEHMAFVVADRMQTDFKGLLEATVFVRRYD